MENSIFSTKATDDALVAELVGNVDRYVSAEGKVKASEIPAGIKYSRAWLILRRAWVEAYAPKLITDATPTAKAVATATKLFGDQPDFEKRHILGPIVVSLHDEGCSWGEIMVRTGEGEGKVRKAFELSHSNDRKSRGLRTGKGGRFVADRGDPYQENRISEGAVIPFEAKVSSVPVEALLNFIAAEA